MHDHFADHPFAHPETHHSMATDALVHDHIKVNPRHPGDARLVEQGTPVWVVIDFDLAVSRDTERVMKEYGLSQESVEAARRYYQRNKSIIDARRAIATATFQ